MSTSSANPETLIEYAASMYNEGQAVLDHLGRAGITETLDAVRTRCSEYVHGEIPDVDGQVRTTTLGAQELDVWAGAVGQAFLLADTSGAAGVAHVDDGAVIANLPPGLADPPAETRGKIDEGQRLFDDLMKATDERDHDRIQQILGILKDRQGDTAFLAGFAMKVDKLGGSDALEQRLKDGMRPQKHGGFLGGLRDFAEGAWDSVWGTVTMLGGLTIQVFTDPGKWAENWANLGKGVWQGITNPGEFLKNLIDVDGFNDNPARWLGSFVPDLAAAVLTDGAGAATRGAKGLDIVTDLAEASRNLDRASKGLKVTDGLSDISGTIRHLDPDLLGVRNALRKRLIDQGRTPQQADAVANRVASGTQFNRDNWHRYPFNEVRLTNGKVLDSYNPRLGEIVSRKYTQLADVQPATAREYINEAVRKYPEGQEIASSPSVLLQEERTGREIAGQRLQGDIVLEVPSQVKRVPLEVLNYARSKGVTIRTTEGKVLTP
ncbi:MAG: hypothetical protein ACRDTX_22765 [Pseudonocardiaceae bacterium]